MGKGKKRKTFPYCKTIAPGKYVCERCNYVTKRYHSSCPSCHDKNELVYYSALSRSPKRHKSKKKWKTYKLYKKAHLTGCR